MITQLTFHFLLILQNVTGPMSDPTSLLNKIAWYSEEHREQKCVSSSSSPIISSHVSMMFKGLGRKPVTHAKIVTEDFKEGPIPSCVKMAKRMSKGWWSLSTREHYTPRPKGAGAGRDGMAEATKSWSSSAMSISTWLFSLPSDASCWPETARNQRGWDLLYKRLSLSEHRANPREIKEKS